MWAPASSVVTTRSTASPLRSSSVRVFVGGAVRQDRRRDARGTGIAIASRSVGIRLEPRERLDRLGPEHALDELRERNDEPASVTAAARAGRAATRPRAAVASNSVPIASKATARSIRSVVPAPQALDRRAPPLVVEPTLDRRARRLRLAARARHAQRLAQLLDEPVGRQLAVAQLAALVLRDRSQHRPELRRDAALLRR